MGNKRKNRVIAFALIAALLFTSIGLSVLSAPSYAADGGGTSPSTIEVTVRIEDDDSTLLAPTALEVERFDILPFITGPAGSYNEPTQIYSIHALIEAIFYDNFGYDPTSDDLASPAAISSIKEDLTFVVGSYGLSLSSIYGNSNLVMSSVNNSSGFGIGSDLLSNGDTLVFYPWSDRSYNELAYSYFTQSEVQGVGNNSVILSLKSIIYDIYWNSSITAVDNATILINNERSEFTTNSNGNVSLTFDSPGEYIISAEKGSPNTISRPYCKVTIEEGIGLSSFIINTPDQWGNFYPTDVLSLMDSHYSYEISVNNAVSTFSAIAVSSETDATITADYTKADGTQTSKEIVSGEAFAYDLAVGRNILELTLEKDGEIKSYRATVIRKPVLASLEVNLPGGTGSTLSLTGAESTRLNIADSNITGISAVANKAHSGQNITARYTKAGGTISSPVTMENGLETTLPNSIGNGVNTFQFTVTENQASSTYTLIIYQVGSESSDTTITTMINTIASGDFTYDSDWIFSMAAAGKASLISPEDKNNYLSSVLIQARSSGTDVARLAKMIIALTAMGIDPRQVPDAEGFPINLVSKLSNAATTADLGLYGIYTAPYILLAYDSGQYEVDPTASLSRREVLDYILENQSSNDYSWSGDVDTTAMVLPCLSAYRTVNREITDGATIDKVNTAINNAVSWLSAQQGADGSFSSWGSKNSNSSSAVVIALSLLNINADTDSRFVKGSISALDDLLSYRTTDNRFGYLNNSYNAYATQQGFEALVSYKNLMAGNGGNIFKFSPLVTLYDQWPDAKILTDILVTSYPATHDKGVKLTPNDLEVKAKYKSDKGQELVVLSGSDYTISDYDYQTTGSKTVRVSYQGRTASFVVTVIDPNAPVLEFKTIKLSVQTKKGYLIKNKTYVIEEKVTTVLDALKSALAKEGYTVELNAAGNYVERIDGIGEFDLGANSGWLYSINGYTPPTTSADDYILRDGDVVLWYYTLDYTKDPSSEQWVDKEENASVIEAVVDSSGKATATIAKKDFSALVTDKVNSLKIKSDIATLTFDQNAIKTISEGGTGDIKITAAKLDTSKLSDAEKKQIGNRPVYEFTVTNGSKTISDFHGRVSVSIPYTPASGEDPSALIIYYLDSNGKLEMVKDCKYDSTAGTVVFSTNHFSKYVIGYQEVSFQDVNGHWSETNIRYLSARGIINGKAENKFMPNDSITRAEFVTILGNKLGVDFSKYSQSSFSDVRPADWFAGAVAWASGNGIVTGSDGKFRPNDRINRQEMAVVLDRYMTDIEKRSMPQETKTSVFYDQNKIASYAKASVSKMQQLGIINGKTSTSFAPDDYATRGEAAKMITIMIKTGI
ncbi:S-layer homology domain-containing protein [Sinanaerobacter chloroacetimidivorans]|uniref:S-layer homology domain-containing protein n=1 Tax=Sinanaerobacter chloroacetimidivorans TaxID=2818044 RepID=A0A8J8B215_9FIRM|nr:S-layer homology domain-containing protein [Sinanaerobacter chloroacetimidivorans]MBR0598271.1 S-layer homology domain-containing protein [Sinanaerobacter chloroacetimidivorans]